MTSSVVLGLTVKTPSEFRSDVGDDEILCSGFRVIILLGWVFTICHILNVQDFIETHSG